MSFQLSTSSNSSSHLILSSAASTSNLHLLLSFHTAHNHQWTVKTIDHRGLIIAKVKAKAQPLQRHQRDTRVPSPQPPPSRPPPQKQPFQADSTGDRFTMVKCKPGHQSTRRDNRIYNQPDQLLTETNQRRTYIKRLMALLADLPTTTIISITSDVHRRMRKLSRTPAETSHVSSTVNHNQF
jgi:hypothetical protein